MFYFLALKKCGWYQKWVRQVIKTANPVENIKNINLDGGELIKNYDINCASNLPENVIEKN